MVELQPLPVAFQQQTHHQARLQSVSAWLKLYSNHSETDQLVARGLALIYHELGGLVVIICDLFLWP